MLKEILCQSLFTIWLYVCFGVFIPTSDRAVLPVETSLSVVLCSLSSVGVGEGNNWSYNIFVLFISTNPSAACHSQAQFWLLPPVQQCTYSESFYLHSLNYFLHCIFPTPIGEKDQQQSDSLQFFFGCCVQGHCQQGLFCNFCYYYFYFLFLFGELK